MNAPHVLLIDNSNTRTKFMRAQAGLLLPELRVMPTANISLPRVHELLQGWDYERVLICSVVPACAAILRGLLPGEHTHCLSAHSPLAVELDYPAPLTIGADRLANAHAAALRAPRFPCIVVDAGTAITYDVVEAGQGGKPRFTGGVIAAGLNSMVLQLSSQTAQLPPVGIDGHEPPPAHGKSTHEALRAGAFYGYVGAVHGVLQSLSAHLGCRPYVIATGGDGALLKAHLEEIDEFCSTITFGGLASLSREIW